MKWAFDLLPSWKPFIFLQSSIYRVPFRILMLEICFSTYIFSLCQHRINFAWLTISFSFFLRKIKFLGCIMWNSLMRENRTMKNDVVLIRTSFFSNRSSTKIFLKQTRNPQTLNNNQFINSRSRIYICVFRI